MDIAALSIALNQSTLRQDVGIALTKKVMEESQQNANQLVEMLQATHPNLGHSIDIKA